MKSINFDNPYLLLLLIPLLAAVIVPYLIVIRKENRSKSVIASLVIHAVIAVLVALGIAGLNVQTVVSQTQVYVLADVSYSANRNLDTVDEYVRGVEKELPLNSKLGVVVFARDQQLKTPLGEKFDTVQGSSVDVGATDIAGALKYAADLFDDGVIKRVVLITDGKQTDGQPTEQIISAVESLHSADVKIDAVFLDDNIPETLPEVQVSGVEFTSATYLDHQTTADVLLQSTVDTEVILTLWRKSADASNYEKFSVRAENVVKGYNVVYLPLPTNEEGTFDYRLEVQTADAEMDTSSLNNEHRFTQSVEDHLQVMLLSSKMQDAVAIGKRYAEKANVQAYVRRLEEKRNPNNLGKFETVFVTYQILFSANQNGDISVLINTPDRADARKAAAEFAGFASVESESAPVEIPYTVEDLCLFDEIFLSSFDVRNLASGVSFMQNLKTVVTAFGKTLITSGDLQLHNRLQEKEEGTMTEEDSNALDTLQNIMPVTYGPSEQDAKMYGILVDISRSMESQKHFAMAKNAALQILSLLEDDDFVTIVSFAGGVSFAALPQRVGPNRADLINDINNWELTQGTFLGAALDKMAEFMARKRYYQEQVFLVSDGITSTAETENPIAAVNNMRADGVVVNVINTGTKDGNVSVDSTDPLLSKPETLLKTIAEKGGGAYYYVETEEDLAKVLVEDIADQVTESVIEKQTNVKIKRFTDDLVDGITALPDVYGFVTSDAKSGANTVLTVDYQKESGGWVEVPLYAYWKCGDGKVASFTGELSGAWLQGWEDGAGELFFDNVLTENIPAVKNDYPFKLTLTETDSVLRVEVTPYEIDPQEQVVATLISENGERTEQSLIFDTTRYYYEFALKAGSKYELKVVYTRGSASYEANVFYNSSYLTEYNAFETYDASKLHQFIRHRGTVSENGKVDLSNDENEIETYTQYYTVFLMTAAVVLFVADVIVRKIRWVDIQGLFKRKKKGGKTK